TVAGRASAGRTKTSGGTSRVPQQLAWQLFHRFNEAEGRRYFAQHHAGAKRLPPRAGSGRAGGDRGVCTATAAIAGAAGPRGKSRYRAAESAHLTVEIHPALRRRYTSFSHRA